MKKISVVFFVLFLLVLISSCNGNNTVVPPTSTDNLALTQTPLVTDTPTIASTPSQLPTPTNTDKKFDLITFIISIVISIIFWIIFGRKFQLKLVRRNKAKLLKEELEKRRELEEQHSRDYAEAQQRRREEQQRREKAEIERQKQELDKKQRAESEWRKQPVRFHALWNRYIFPNMWQTLLVYIFIGQDGYMHAKSDFDRRRTVPSEHYDDSSSMSREEIKKGTQISIIPELEGFRFNPPVVNVLLLEDWHCIEFRMQALPESKLDKPCNGQISFYVGPILIGETNLYATVTKPEGLRSAQTMEQAQYQWNETSTSPYRAIFVSYSHRDSIIVDKLQLAYNALGDQYLRDILVLRSGEEWNPALLGKINEANIFQLCWSEAAKQSTYVEQEWRHALSLNRQNFIRPMYWQLPMPKPPEELSKIHFAFVNMTDS